MLYNSPVRILIAIIVAAVASPSLFASDIWWSVQTSGLDTNLRGASVNTNEAADGRTDYIVWAPGSNGVILRSTDDGKTWKQLTVNGGRDLDFRDIKSSTRIPPISCRAVMVTSRDSTKLPTPASPGNCSIPTCNQAFSLTHWPAIRKRIASR